MPEPFPRLAELRDRRLDAWRAELADRLIRRALELTIAGNPVDTARSRAAWVKALAASGGTAPPGWRGSRSERGAIAEGTARGSLARAETPGRSLRAATNAVEYINFLEHGTSGMQPVHMVRRALVQLRGELARLLPPLREQPSRPAR